MNVLNDDGRREWDRIVSLLGEPEDHRMQLMIESYAMWHQHVLLLARHIAENGAVIADGDTLREDPAVKMMAGILDTMRHTLASLGVEVPKGESIDDLVKRISNN